MKKKIVYTADDEEPNCIKCENCYNDESYCEEECGPIHGWCGYKRVEMLEV